MALNRRQFFHAAAAIGASLAWGGPARASRSQWRERRDRYPEGVASGDPTQDGVILWTRRPFESGETAQLTCEVAEDEGFRRVVASQTVTVSAAADWTSSDGDSLVVIAAEVGAPIAALPGKLKMCRHLR